MIRELSGGAEGDLSLEARRMVISGARWSERLRRDFRNQFQIWIYKSDRSDQTNLPRYLLRFRDFERCLFDWRVTWRNESVPFQFIASHLGGIELRRLTDLDLRSRCINWKVWVSVYCYSCKFFRSDILYMFCT